MSNSKIPSSIESSVNTTSEKLWTPKSIRNIGIAALNASGRVDTGGEPTQLQVLADLEPLVAQNLDRHNNSGNFWVPRDFFPIDDDGKIINRAEDLEGEQPLLSPTAQAAMILNLLTEDNLPAYHRVIAANYGLDGAWGNWVNKWTAEEGRHAYVMRAYLDLTGAVDTYQLEVDRDKQVTKGFDDGDKDPLHALAYVSFQELATRVSHRNTGEACNEPIADAMLARISKDENLHMLFYRNLVAGAFDIAPNQTMRAVTDEVVNFEMPGANMDNYLSKSLMIANAGIYDNRLHHDKVIMPILRKWKVFEREDLSDDGEAARQELAEFMEKLEKKASRFEDQRDSGLIQKVIDRALATEAELKP